MNKYAVAPAIALSRGPLHIVLPRMISLSENDILYLPRSSQGLEEPSVIVDAFTNVGHWVFTIAEVMPMVSDLATIVSFVVLCTTKLLPVLYPVLEALLKA